MHEPKLDDDKPDVHNQTERFMIAWFFLDHPEMRDQPIEIAEKAYQDWLKTQGE